MGLGPRDPWGLVSLVHGDALPVNEERLPLVDGREIDICLQLIFLLSSTSVWVFLGKQLASALEIIKPIFFPLSPPHALNPLVHSIHNDNIVRAILCTC